MLSWTTYIEQQTQKIVNFRPRQTKLNGSARQLQLAEQTLLNFISNDYLGLASHPHLRQSVVASSLQYGVGSSGAPSLAGYSAEHAALSQELAAWLGFDRCLLFSSGYQLNVSLFSCLVDSNTCVWLDRNCHASHIDGVLLAKAKFKRFGQNDLTKLTTTITEHPQQRHLIISEGCFSMDGLSSYLPELIAIKTQFPDQVLLVIDDAHGLGCLGSCGRGSASALGVNSKYIDLLIGTLGKTLASMGGFVLGSTSIIDYLQHSVRSQIFSTSIPPLLAAAARSALGIITSEEGTALRQQLADNIHYLQHLAIEAKLPLWNYKRNQSPIQVLLLPSIAKLEQIHASLLKHKLQTAKIKYPTVAKTSPRLRLSLTAAHLHSDIEHLVMHLAQAYYA